MKTWRLPGKPVELAVMVILLLHAYPWRQKYIPGAEKQSPQNIHFHFLITSCNVWEMAV